MTLSKSGRKKGFPRVPYPDAINNVIQRPEAAAWRDGFQAWLDARFDALDTIIEAQQADLTLAILRGDEKAQSANDALQRLLESHMQATEAMAKERSEAKLAAISELKVMLHSSAAQAVEAVEGRSLMRYDSAVAFAKGSSDKSDARIESLQRMIEVRSQMNDVAIGKAESANEKRFEAVNEFRQTLSDQAQNFVTRTMLDGRFQQITAMQTSSDDRSREGVDRNRQSVGELSARVSSMEGKVYIGGAGVVVIVAILQLVINLLRHSVS